MEQKAKRIEWVDVYKGLAIVLVVVGHATGKFNAYIYQFHVAAFFFISGWVAHFDKDILIKDIYKKFMTLILPLFTMVVLYGILLRIFGICGIFNCLFGADINFNVGDLIKKFIQSGSVIDLLGAAWFVIVLFIASILSHIFYIVSFRNKWVFGTITLVVYIYGYMKMKSGFSMPYNADIALVAQGYYGLGYLIKQIEFKKVSKYFIVNLFILVMSSLNMYIMKKYLNGANLMDIANRQINSLGWTTVAILNGTVWLYSFSQIICSCNVIYIKQIILNLGKHSLGILFFHFSFFRVVAMVLCIIGLTDVSEIKNLVPSEDISNRFWLIYVLVALICSWHLWNVMCQIPILKQLLGRDKEFIDSILNIRVIQEIVMVYSKISNAIICGLKDAFYQKQFFKDKLLAISCVIIIVSCFAVKFIPKVSIIEEEEINEVSQVIGELQVSFPYNGDKIEFVNGWLDQSDEEKYRWVRKESTFKILLSNQNTIKMYGFVPAGINNLSYAKLYLNDHLIDEKNITGEQELILDGVITDAKIEGDNIFKVVFDGERVPEENDLDRRSFSAMFTLIEIR